MQDAAFTVRWALRDACARVIREGSEQVRVPALSAVWLQEMNFDDAQLHDNYVSYDLFDGETWISGGSVLFCAPKHFDFVDPHLKVWREGDEIIVSASAYARSVEIECDDGDLLLEDNYFDMNGGERRVRILRGEGKKLRVRSVYDI